MLRYYNGTHGSPATGPRWSYYGVTGTPTLVFNGRTKIVGASSNDVDGAKYMALIRDRSFDPSPIEIEVENFDPASGQTDVSVTMHSASASLDGDDILFLLVEDDVALPRETHVTRAMINDTITLNGQGSVAHFNPTFTIDPEWAADKLYVVVFVQRADKDVVQAASSSPQPLYKARAMVPFGRSVIGPEAPYLSPALTIMNLGMDDDFTAQLVVDSMPAGWTASFADGVGVPHSDSWQFFLTSGQQADFRFGVEPTSPGYMQCHLEVTSPNLESPISIPFVYVTDTVDALLVDDDGGYAYEDYFAAALDDAGLTYGLRDIEASKLSVDIADSIGLLVWNVGLGYPSLDASDRDFLESFLDSGRSLFLSGQDIGWDLCSGSSGNEDVLFYRNYLHARYISDDTNILDLDPVADDPVADGLFLHIAGGDGADNEDYPSWIEPYDDDAVRIFTYSGFDGGAAIRARDSESQARIVYLAFGFEAIDNPADRSALMAAAIRWLNGPRSRDEVVSDPAPAE